MPYLPRSTKEKVYRRANNHCEYCLAPQAVGVPMEIDHVIPISANGSSDLENLCLACTYCNGSKSDLQTGIDPETEQEQSLFNPRVQRWHDHFFWNADQTQIMGRTATGRATVTRLKMNRSHLRTARTYWVQMGLYPPVGI